MNKIPIKFEHKGKEYEGILSQVSGAGSAGGMYHLMIDNYYYGMVHQQGERWVYHGKYFEDMGDFFERYLIAWYE